MQLSAHESVIAEVRLIASHLHISPLLNRNNHDLLEEREKETCPMPIFRDR